MSLERELKLLCLGDPPELDGLSSLAGRALERLDTERQDNTYLDTPDLALAAAGCSLRIRRVGDRAVATFKGPSEHKGALVSRTELERDLPAGDSGPDAIPPELLAPALEAASGQALVPVARLRTTRRRYRLEGVGEVALDRTRVLNEHGSVVGRFREVEVELDVGADENLLDEVARALGALAPLSPAPDGKLARALRLLAGTGALPELTPWALAAARSIAPEIERLRALIPVARALGTDGVHQARVVTRRLRAALRVFRSAMPDQPGLLAAELRWAARRLGAVRDLDVLLEAWPAHVEAAGIEPEPLEPARALLEADREAAIVVLRRTLDSRRLEKLLGRLDRLAGTILPRAAARPPGSLSVAAEGRPALRRVLRRVERRARAALEPDSPLGAVHELRKSAKRARYALEFLEPALDKAAARAANDLASAQGALGAMNDLVVADARVRELAGRVPSQAAFELGRLAASLDARVGEARIDLEREWRGLDLKESRRAVLRAIEG